MQRPSPDHTLLVKNKLKEERESFGEEARELHKRLGEPHEIATELAAEDAFTRDEKGNGSCPSQHGRAIYSKKTWLRNNEVLRKPKQRVFLPESSTGFENRRKLRINAVVW